MFFRERSERNLFLLAVYSPGIIFTLLVSTHHPHNSQRCEPVTAKLWKTLHPKQSQQPKGAPCCWELILTFDTCTAGIPLSSTLVGLPAALYRRCTKTGYILWCHIPLWSLTLRSCDTAWVWVPGCTKPNGVEVRYPCICPEALSPPKNRTYTQTYARGRVGTPLFTSLHIDSLSHPCLCSTPASCTAQTRGFFCEIRNIRMGTLFF